MPQIYFSEEGLPIMGKRKGGTGLLFYPVPRFARGYISAAGDGLTMLSHMVFYPQVAGFYFYNQNFFWLVFSLAHTIITFFKFIIY
jgi:hypothetical protein